MAAAYISSLSILENCEYAPDIIGWPLLAEHTTGLTLLGVLQSTVSTLACVIMKCVMEDVRLAKSYGD